MSLLTPTKRRKREPGEFAPLRLFMQQMQPGDWFDYWHSEQTPYTTARRVGIKVTLRKKETGGWRVWRQK